MKKENIALENFINKPYQYGFSTNVEKEKLNPGLNIETIKLLSKKKNEPNYMLEFRLKSYSKWKKMSEPAWSRLTYPKIEYDNIVYYSAPKKKEKYDSLDEVSNEIKETFEKLGIPLNEQKRLANVAVDAVFDSVSIATTFKKELFKHGVIFCSISEAIKKYPTLVRQYLASVVPVGDNFYVALNSAVFSDGSFCYIPKNTRCPLELSTYFRINDQEAGQFERTLIVAETNSYVSYLEGCTAPQYSTNQLHAAVVELIAFENATIKYSTVQNWYAGDENGIGGVYNFVTKRGLCLGRNSHISWTQIETGSSLTWKYPSCILMGDNSSGEFYSVAITNNCQQADTGTKMIHLGKHTRSRIISKGISAKKSINSYRGLVKINPNGSYSRNYSQCDSLLLGSESNANTFPYIQVYNAKSKIEHEASTSRIGEEQIFYLRQRGIDIEDAIGLIISGFCREVFKELPMEFAEEANRLLNLKLEGSVG